MPRFNSTFSIYFSAIHQLGFFVTIPSFYALSCSISLRIFVLGEVLGEDSRATGRYTGIRSGIRQNRIFAWQDLAFRSQCEKPLRRTGYQVSCLNFF